MLIAAHVEGFRIDTVNSALLRQISRESKKKERPTDTAPWLSREGAEGRAEVLVEEPEVAAEVAVEVAVEGEVEGEVLLGDEEGAMAGVDMAARGYEAQMARREYGIELDNDPSSR